MSCTKTSQNKNLSLLLRYIFDKVTVYVFFIEKETKNFFCILFAITYEVCMHEENDKCLWRYCFHCEKWKKKMVFWSTMLFLCPLLLVSCLVLQSILYMLTAPSSSSFLLTRNFKDGALSMSAYFFFFHRLCTLYRQEKEIKISK